MTEALTKNDEYQPTTAELKILDILSDPNSYRLSITEKCEIAKVSRETYYKTMRKSQFVNLIPKTALELVKQRAIDLINASYKAAVSGSFNDREMLLEIAELKQSKGTKINLQQNTVIPILGGKSIEKSPNEEEGASS